ncbi:MAG: EthD family reductase [Burkholderiales bacterium]
MLRQPVNFTLGLSGFTFTNIRLITTRETSMIRISILYPNNKGSRFDVSYYVETHMPISIKLLSDHPGFKGVSVEHGLSGAVPGSEPTYIAMCHFLFSSVEDFLAAFMPNAEVLQGDMPNYTDREPVIQFNEVLISR